MKSEWLFAGVLVLAIFCITVIALAGNDADLARQALDALTYLVR